MDTSEKRYWDLPAVSLLVAALWVAALRLWVTNWTQHLEIVEMFVFSGVVIGLALGKSIFKHRAVRWIGFLYTLFVIPWQLGGHLVDAIYWNERLQSLAGRLNDTTYYFLHNKPVQDPILFIASMGLLYWLISIIAGYSLVRYGRPWVALGVSALAVMLIEYYNPFTTRASVLTGLYIFFVLMLIGRLHYVMNRRNWDENNVSVDAEAGFDLSRGTIVTGLVLVIMAWNFPTVVKAFSPGTQEREWVQISWQGLRNRLSNMVVSLQSPAANSTNDFGSQLGLGTGAQQGNDTALVITPLNPVPDNVRLYMRGRVYDTYEDGTWNSTLKGQLGVAAGQESFAYPAWTPSERVDVRIQSMLGSSRTLYTPGRPVTVSRTASAQIDALPENQVDVVALMADSPLHSGDVYSVQGAVPVPTIRQLKDSPMIYPEEVQKLYLQMPTDFPANIHNLAITLTQQYNNPYDKANVITQYLRDNITYAISIPAPPENVEPLEWFVFSYKQGYCNYYASAEVMMLRSIGIPARMAVGFAEGKKLPGGTYTVKLSDSHAWPEVYFYGIGWVPFEPTAAQPVLERPVGVDPNGANSQDAQNQQDFAARNAAALRERNSAERDRDTGPGDVSSGEVALANNPIYRWASLAVALLLLVALVLFYRRQESLGRWKPVPLMLEHNMRKRGLHAPVWLRTWARFTELSPIERSFANIALMLRFLGTPITSIQTPTEQVNALLVLVPEASQPAGVVLEEYQRSIYSRYSPDQDQADHASRQLWRQVLRSWAKKKFGVEVQVT